MIIDIRNKVGGAVASWLVRSTPPSERSGFEPWPGTLCGQDDIYPHSASVHPGV